MKKEFLGAPKSVRESRSSHGQYSFVPAKSSRELNTVGQKINTKPRVINSPRIKKNKQNERLKEHEARENKAKGSKKVYPRRWEMNASRCVCSNSRFFSLILPATFSMSEMAFLQAAKSGCVSGVT